MLELELGRRLRGPRASATRRRRGRHPRRRRRLGYTPYAEGARRPRALRAVAEPRAGDRACFNRALEQDPRYALAHAGLGEALLAPLPAHERSPSTCALARSGTASARSRSTTCCRARGSRSGMIHAGTGDAGAALARLPEGARPRPAQPRRATGSAAWRSSGSDRCDEAEAQLPQGDRAAARPMGQPQLPRRLPVRPRPLREAEAAFRRRSSSRRTTRAASATSAAPCFTRRAGSRRRQRPARALDALRPTTRRPRNLARAAVLRRAATPRPRARSRRPCARRHARLPVWRNLGAARLLGAGRARAGGRRLPPRGAARRRRSARVDPQDAALLADLADCHAMLGRAARRAAPRRARGRSPSRPTTADVAGDRGRRVRAAWGPRRPRCAGCERRAAAGYPRARDRARSAFEELRADPRYACRACVQPGRPRPGTEQGCADDVRCSRVEAAGCAKRCPSTPTHRREVDRHGTASACRPSLRLVQVTAASKFRFANFSSRSSTDG